MKLQLTESAELELKVINQRIEEDEEAYNSLNEHELLVVDAELYVEGCYIENKFNDLNKWCRKVGLDEYDPKYLVKHPNVVKDKVNKMINKGLITIVNS
jgi:hypothetical protein